MECVRLAEEFGLHDVTISDHLRPTPVAPVFECWTTVAAVAAKTCRVNLVGSPDGVIAKIREYADRGAKGFHMSLGRHPSLEAIRRLGEETLPRLASA
jgi:alkanesulfonate monooxygenase SsuD/methylene tetrahydromethanopterin reductase-like flavin-dependent oxidoreductase (luciferase family)